jgi:hypothetical protein
MRLHRAVTYLAGVCLLALTTTVNGKALAAGATFDPDIQEAWHYRLTMEKVQAAITASVKVNKLLESNAALRKKSDDLDNQHFSLDRRAKAIDTSFPEIAAIVRASGLGTREWLLINMAYVSDMMYVGMKKMGQVKDYPPNTITPENAAFVDAHFDQLSQLGQGLNPGR